MTGTELERLIKLYHNSVYATALCRCGDPCDADDVAQEVFLKLYTCEKEFESDEHIKAWLLRCAINRCADIKRSRRKKLTLPLEAAEGMIHHDSKDVGQSALLTAIMKLDGMNRTIIRLYYCEEYSAEEIADMTKLSVTAVRSRIARTRNKLKKLLDKERSL